MLSPAHFPCRHFFGSKFAARKLSLTSRITMGSEPKRHLSSSSSKSEDEIPLKDLLVEAVKDVKTATFEDLHAMSFNQLRTLSKKFGISSRGSKLDLMSALKCFLDNDEDGRNILVPLKMESDVGLSPALSDIKNLSRTSSKRKAKNTKSGVQTQNSNLVAEVSTYQQKRKGKSPKDDGASFKVYSRKISMKQTMSLETIKVPDANPSQAKRKRSAHNKSEDGGVTGIGGLVEKPSEPWTILSHKKPQKGWIPYNPRTMRLPPLDNSTKSVKLISWNVNGLRALLKLDSFSAFAQRENFDVLCLQETKLQEKDVEKIKDCVIDGYDNSFWTCSVSKLGYSGTAIISRMKPLSVRYGLGILDHDGEGRLVTVEFDTFFLISGYVPNSGDGLRRLTYRTTQWDPSLANYMKELEKSKPVILTGDLNCAYEEIDIYNPAGNRRSAGFTKEERESFEVNFLSNGFVDTFRRQHPGVVGYTYWGYRHSGRVDNKGWRLDYFLVSESIADNVHDSYIVPDVMGSDHCPIGLILKL